MYDIQKYTDIVKSRLSEKRFYHSMCVAEKAKELAIQYHLDPEKAYLTGVLHDITRHSDTLWQLQYMTENGYTPTSVERGNPNLLHQISGALFVKNELKIDDEEIINAIRCHTTGKADMSLFETVIYIADVISDDRNYPDLQLMRAQTEKGLLYGMLFALRYVIESCLSKNMPLHPDTLFCYNWVAENLEKENQ